MKMVDLAKQAFSTKNFDLAAEIYERHLRDFGPKLETYLGLADSLAKSGKIQLSIQNYMKAFRLGNIQPDQLNHLVDALVDIMTEKESIRQEGKKEGEKDDMFACGICKALWNDPVTTSCGHTFCRPCLEKSKPRSCTKCKKVFRSANVGNARTSVLLHQTIEKWFGDELQAVKLKTEGNKMFQSRKYEDAIKIYSRALYHAPNDHLLVSNRSYAYAALDQYSSALKDAELAIQMRPDWAKAYFRKAAALEGLSRHEESAYAYLQCLSLDPNVTSAREALAKMLNKILSPLPPEDLKHAELHSMLHMSPLNRMFQESSLQDSHNLPNPTPRLLSVDELTKIKQSLRLSMQQQQLTEAREHQDHGDSALNHPEINQSGELSATASLLLPGNLSQDAKCQSVPTTPKSSPPMLKRALCSASDISQLEPAAHDSRKRSVQAPMSPTRSPAHNKFKKMNNLLMRDVPPELLLKEDFECALCMRLLFEPTTTPCGHTFCRACLDRCLDHNASCPLCKALLAEYLADRSRCMNESVEAIVKTYFPDEYAERKVTNDRELEDFAKMGVDEQHEVPIFVCTLTFPTVPCPLHVFEPRYRLMIRQCMESGTRQFGMCVCFEDSEENYADYGCMLEIRDVQYFPDGRSVVDTVGGRRFKVLSRSTREGYNTAQVEYLRDTPIPPAEVPELLALHDEVHQEARDWFEGLPNGPKTRIMQHFGAFPDREPDVLASPNGPAWLWWELAVLPLDPRAQLALLAMTSLKDRLLGVKRVLQFYQQRTAGPR